MYVCRYVCRYVGIMHVCMYECMYACTYVCMYVCMFVCRYACMHVCMHVGMYVGMYVKVCVYLRMYMFFHPFQQLQRDSRILHWPQRIFTGPRAYFTVLEYQAWFSQRKIWWVINHQLYASPQFTLAVRAGLWHPVKSIRGTEMQRELWDVV